MTTIIKLMPRDPAKRIKFCTVNWKEYPHLTKEAIKQLNELRKNKPQTLKSILLKKLDGWTLLHYAVEHNNPSLCKALLDFGADHSVKDISGMEPLHVAGRHGYKECIQILLDHEADPLARDEQGRRPCQVALDHYKKDAATVLKLAETKDETIVPVVAENQLRIENNCKKVEDLQREFKEKMESMSTTSSMSPALLPQQQRERQSSESQCVEQLADLLTRVNQLEHGCEQNASEIFGHGENNVGRHSHDAELKASGVTIRVTLLENRVSALEKIVQPIKDPKDVEEVALRKKLRKCWCMLKENLTAKKYHDYLFQEGALQLPDLQNIKWKHSIEEQTDEMLMRLFEQKGTKWVGPFWKRLRQENPLVYQKVDSLE